MVTEKTDKKPVAHKATVKAPKPAAAPKAAGPVAPTILSIHRRREMTGVVVSDKMMKTIVVKVDRQVRHEMYKKYLTKSHKFKAHDETNSAKMGDLVLLIESRPLSRDKRWALKSIIRKGGQAPEANV